MEHFLLQLLPTLPDMEMLINVMDYPLSSKRLNPLPVLSFSKVLSSEKASTGKEGGCHYIMHICGAYYHGHFTSLKFVFQSLKTRFRDYEHLLYSCVL